MSPSPVIITPYNTHALTDTTKHENEITFTG